MTLLFVLFVLGEKEELPGVLAPNSSTEITKRLRGRQELAKKIEEKLVSRCSI